MPHPQTHVTGLHLEIILCKYTFIIGKKKNVKNVAENTRHFTVDE